MKPISNHVLIKLTKKTDELQLPGVGTLALETIFNEEQHQRLVGEVITVPEKLTFIKMDHGNMPWETEMEILVGDEVILRRTDVSVSRFEGKSFESEGHLYVHVPYHAVILSKRRLKYSNFPHGDILELDGENYVVTMLNGYMLVQQDDIDFQTEFYIPGNIKNPKAETGIIAFIGKPNTAYHPQFISAGFEYGSQLPDTRFDLKVGDRVAFIKHASVDLEYDIHRTFNGQGNHYVRMQRNKILAKL
jgi:hypothetical protein